MGSLLLGALIAYPLTAGAEPPPGAEAPAAAAITAPLSPVAGYATAPSDPSPLTPTGASPPVQQPATERSLITFFAIGAVINLVVLSLLGTWAYRQLKGRKGPG